MAEFLFINPPEPLKPLLDENFELIESFKKTQCIVANKQGCGGAYAPEIDWFVSKTASDHRAQARIITLMYEARAAQVDFFDGGALGETSGDQGDQNGDQRDQNAPAPKKPSISYNSTLCHYHDHLGDTCTKCVSVCETAAITKNEADHRLIFNAEACTACQSCVGVCPSGALDSTQIPRPLFAEIAALYDGLVPFVITEDQLTDQLAEQNAKIPAGVAPLVLPTINLLDLYHLITLLQSSGSSIVFAGELPRKAGIIDEIWRHIYGVPAFASLQNAQPIVKSRAEIADDNSDTPNKRAQFAARLKAAVGSGDFGVVEAKGFGSLAVDETKCTLCMGCVDSCSVGALSVGEGVHNTGEGALNANDSLCTLCGECAFVCPEKAITPVASGIRLAPQWFAPRTVATDSAFHCVECGKPFATSKSIQKTVLMMTPIFGTDQHKIRAISCCADCKPKVMLRAQLERR